MSVGNPIVSNIVIAPIDGTAAAPSIAFGGSLANSSGTGFFLKSAGVIGVSISGTEVASWTSTGPVESGTIDLADGTAAAPSLAFTNATTTGLYKSGTDAIGIATAGVAALTINSSQAVALAGALTTVGNVGLGGAVSSSVILNIGATNPLTGADQRGTQILPTFTSAATTRGIGIISNSTTAAAAFTMPALFQFYSQDVTKGAGSTITRSIGYYVEVPTSGTNNAGISDNQSFSSNYFINSTNTNPSLLSGPLSIAPTTNQLVLGTTRTITISATQPATSSRVYTIPDQGAAANFLMSAAAQTIAGVQTFSAAPIMSAGVTGTITNDSAAVGIVGETVVSNLLTASAVSLTTGTAATVTSISLTAGDWDVSGAVVFKPGATTSVTLLGSAISQTTNAVPATIGNDTGGEILIQQATAANVLGTDSTIPISRIRVSLSGTTTVYLVAKATFGVSTLGAYGTIRARRVR